MGQPLENQWLHTSSHVTLLHASLLPPHSQGFRWSWPGCTHVNVPERLLSHCSVHRMLGRWELEPLMLSPPPVLSQHAFPERPNPGPSLPARSHTDPSSPRRPRRQRRFLLRLCKNTWTSWMSCWGLPTQPRGSQAENGKRTEGNLSRKMMGPTRTQIS